MLRMKTVISVANVAARSGKTTVAVNLAAELASRGLRTLLIDADPQAHATQFFIKPDQIVGMLSDVLLPQSRNLSQHPSTIWDVFSPASFPYLGVVAGDIRLAAFDGWESARAADLGARLASISDFHDVAILDTPSALALLTRACLSASTHVLAPVSPGGQGEEGLHLIYEYVGGLPGGDARPELSVVCNRFDCRDRSSGLLDERLRAEWGGKVFETIVHSDDQVEAGTECRQTIRELAPTSAAAALYARLADEVSERFSLTPAGQATTAEWQ